MLLPTRFRIELIMKKIFLYLLLIALASCEKSNAQIKVLGIKKDNHITGINFSGKTVVFMGNSITYGVASSDNDHRWTTIFSTARGATEDNHGVSSTTMQSFSAGCGNFVFDKTTIPSYNGSTHSALIIALGVNDIGFNVAASTSSAFYTAYSDAITYAISTKSWPSSKIILLNAFHPYSWNTYVGACTPGVASAADAARVADFNSKIQQVATENGCWYIDIYSAMNGLNSSYFNGDELHPNDAGHAFIANYLIDQL